MDENKSESLNSIKNIILDERRLVTYTSISKELCIHVNKAKIFLREFVDELRKNKPNVALSVSYIISGSLKNNKLLTILVLEEELVSVKDKFSTIFFEHIYSVCYGHRTSIDKSAFIAINTFEDYLLCKGTVKNNICSKRSYEEIGTLKFKSQEVPEKNLKNSIKKDLKNSIKEENHNTQNEVKTIKDHDKKTDPVKSEIPSPKYNSVTNNKSLDKKSNGKSNGSIMGFLSKTPNVKMDISKKDKGDIENKTKITKKLDREETNIDDSSKTNGTEIKLTEKKSVNSIIAQKNEASTQKKDIKVEKIDIEVKVRNKKTNQGNSFGKKRKRVLHVSDSDSDCEKSDSLADEITLERESEDEIPPTPSATIVNITPGLVNAKKRRKIIDKTYTDEEGFMLTKKEEIYESCSDDEVHTKENVDIKKQVTVETTALKNVPIKQSKKKSSPSQKHKQPTMMNFFKKVPN
ncbi:DNA polymerase delta subunit 3-like [Bombyx mandarina]|uniref:DNA polymerase delta subunit 3 n=1 Tax=Bombyx mandarina TaxID=7092 RepID=A0A6J2JMC6_BOMMA|nr:DNA polymerase delta subunit 3-like [Bombyx mandarina]